MHNRLRLCRCSSFAKKTLKVLKLSLLALACVFVLQTRASTARSRCVPRLSDMGEDSSPASPIQEMIKKGEQPQEGGPCPPKSKLAELPNQVPTSGEFESLLNDMAREYGRRLAKARPAIDGILAKAQRETDGPNLGALLAGMGAGSASVYTLAQSALKKPGDVLIAPAMAGVYRPRHPERTILYRVLFHYFDRIVSEYEIRFDWLFTNSKNLFEESGFDFLDI